MRISPTAPPPLTNAGWVVLKSGSRGDRRICRVHGGVPQGEAKRRALTGAFTKRRERAALSLGQTPGNVEAEAQAAEALLSRSVPLLNGIEHRQQQRGLNADAFEGSDPHLETTMLHDHQIARVKALLSNARAALQRHRNHAGRSVHGWRRSTHGHPCGERRRRKTPREGSETHHRADVGRLRLSDLRRRPRRRIPSGRWRLRSEGAGQGSHQQKFFHGVGSVWSGWFFPTVTDNSAGRTIA